jgi:hypothetical protein
MSKAAEARFFGRFSLAAARIAMARPRVLRPVQRSAQSM